MMKESHLVKQSCQDGRTGPARILAHMCCGPCSVYPLKTALRGIAEVWGFFHNPNIHPYSEFKRRLDAVKALARALSIDVIYNEEYRGASFIKGLRRYVAEGAAGSYRDRAMRCRYCCASRLEETARTASERGFDAFTTTLLYSRHQDHDMIREAGVDLAGKYGILFYYEDFRAGWQEGVDESRRMGLYRQRWCGCIYSRAERYARKGKA